MIVIRWWTWPCDDGPTMMDLTLWWWSFGDGLEFAMLDVLAIHLWISKFWYHMHWSKGYEYIACQNCICEWIVKLITCANYSILVVLSTINIYVFLPHVCFLCYSLRMWVRYSSRARGALDIACLENDVFSLLRLLFLRCLVSASRYNNVTLGWGYLLIMYYASCWV